MIIWAFVVIFLVVTLLVSALCLYFFMVSKLQLMEYLGAKYLSVYYTVSSPLNCWRDFSVLIKFVEVEDGIVLIVLPCIFVTIRALCFQNFNMANKHFTYYRFFVVYFECDDSLAKLKIMLIFSLCRTSLRVSFY